VQTDHVIGRQARVLGDAGEVEVQFITTRQLVPSRLEGRGVGRVKPVERRGDGGRRRDAEVKENGDAGICLDDVDAARNVRGASGRREPPRGGLVGEASQDGRIAKRKSFHHKGTR
jgi:hypothetical protein